MNPAPEIHQISDSRRDAERYHKLLLALQKIRRETRLLGIENQPGARQVLQRILPSIVETFDAANAFVALLQQDEATGRDWLEMKAVYPPDWLAGARLDCTPGFAQMLSSGEGKVFEPLDDSAQVILPELEQLKAASAVIVPLFTSHQKWLVGICGKSNLQRGPFLASDRMALENILELVIMGSEIGERRQREMNIIKETLDAIRDEPGPDQLLNLIACGARRVFEASAASVMVWDSRKESLEIKASDGLSQTYIKEQRISREIINLALARLNGRRTLYTPDLSTSPFGRPALVIQERLCSALSTQLLSTGDLIGILNIYSKDQPREFNSDDFEIAEIFADQFAIAIRNTELRRRELEGLLNTSEALKTTLDPKILLQLLVQKASQIYAAPAAALLLPHAENNILTITASTGLSPAYTQDFRLEKSDFIARASVGDALQPFCIDDVAQESFGALQYNQAEQIRSILAAPVLITSDYAGLLVIYSKVNLRKFQPSEIDLAQIIANQAAAALQIARAFEGEQTARINLDQTLHTISQIAAAGELGTGLDALARGMVEILNVTFCHILIYDEQAENMKVTAAYLVPRSQSPKTTWRPRLGSKVYKKENPGLFSLLSLDRPCAFQKGKLFYGINIVNHVRDMVGLNGDLQSILIIPLVAGKNILGICTLGEERNWERDPINAEKKDKAASLAGQAVELVDRIRAHKAREKLRKAGETISRILTQDTHLVMDCIARCACNLLAADNAIIYPFLSDLQIYDVRNIGSYRLLDSRKKFSAKLRNNPRSMATKVLESDEPLVVEDLTTGWDRSKKVDLHTLEKQFIRREKVVSFIGLKLQVGGRPVGVLFTNFRRLHHFSPEEIENIEIFASQAAFSIEQALLFQRGEKDHKAIQAAQEVMRLVAKVSDPQPVWEAILDGAHAITRASRGWFFTWDKTTARLQQPACCAFSSLERVESRAVGPYTADLLADTAVQAKSLLVFDLSEDTSLDGYCKENPGMPSLLAVPIRRANDQTPRGVILLEGTQRGLFNPDDRKLVEDLALYADVAVESTAHYSEVIKHSQLLLNLLKAGESIATLVDLDKVFRSITDAVQEALQCSSVTLYTCSGTPLQISPHPWVSGSFMDLSATDTLGYVDENSVVSKIIRAGKPRFANDSTRDEMMAGSQFVRREGIRSSAGIPLVAGDEIVGIFFVNFTEPHFFSEDEKKAILVFANQAAIAILNANLYKSLFRKQDYLKAVYQAGKTITASVGLERKKILDQILKQAAKLTGQSGKKATIGSIHLLDDDELVLECIYPDDNPPGMLVKVGSRLSIAVPGGRLGIIRRAFFTREAQPVPDISRDPDYDLYNTQSRCELAIPLLDLGHAIGVLNVEWDQENAFDDDDLSALSALAELAVIAIRNADHAELLSQANNVALMGAWGAELAHEVNREIGVIHLQTYLLQQDVVIDEDKARLKIIDEAAGNLEHLDISGPLIIPGQDLSSPAAPEVDVVVSVEMRQFANGYPWITFKCCLGCAEVRIAMHEQWLRRILRHLVRNAIKAIPPEKSERLITMQTRCEGKMVIVQVEDNGCGVPLERLPLLFRKRFERTTNGDGSGLLLVDYLVRQHRGKTRLLWSRIGEGACFAFYIPRLEQNDEEVNDERDQQLPFVDHR